MKITHKELLRRYMKDGDWCTLCGYPRSRPYRWMDCPVHRSFVKEASGSLINKVLDFLNKMINKISEKI